jgi:hypothetical protein
VVEDRERQPERWKRRGGLTKRVNVLAGVTQVRDLLEGANSDRNAGMRFLRKLGVQELPQPSQRPIAAVARHIHALE